MNFFVDNILIFKFISKINLKNLPKNPVEDRFLV